MRVDRKRGALIVLLSGTSVFTTKCSIEIPFATTTHFLALAIIAVAPALRRTVYHVLAMGQEYRNLGQDYNEHRDVDRARARAVHALERLGVKVTVEAAA
jgi:hypothetical protein